MLSQSLRRRIALWLCPELATRTPIPFDPAELPVFQGKGRVPRWWSHAELRDFLTTSHGKMKMVQAHKIARERFGDEAPSRSALQRYWADLDALRDQPPVQQSPSQEAV